MGDPAGISAEITVNAWSSRSEVKIPPFIFFGSEELLHRRASYIDCKIKTKKLGKRRWIWLWIYLKMYTCF